MSKTNQQNPEQTPPAYNYQILEPLFTDIATPLELAGHIDQALFVLTWYEHQGEALRTDMFNIYQSLFMLKELLQLMEKESKNS
jgi:hypothetical protein